MATSSSPAAILLDASKRADCGTVPPANPSRVERGTTPRPSVTALAGSGTCQTNDGIAVIWSMRSRSGLDDPSLPVASLLDPR